jgi:hypothetical protein
VTSPPGKTCSPASAARLEGRSAPLVNEPRSSA